MIFFSSKIKAEVPFVDFPLFFVLNKRKCLLSEKR